MTDAQQREQNYWLAVDEVARGSPVYEYKPNPFYLLICLAVLGACLAPVFFPFPFDWAVIYIAPVVVFFLIAANYGGIINRIGGHYKDELRPRIQTRYQARGINVDALLDSVWARKQRTPSYLGILYLVVAAVSVGIHFWHVFGDVVLSQLVTWQAWLSFIGRVLLFVLGVLVALLTSIAVMMAIWGDTKFSYDQLALKAFGPRWDVDVTESNLLEIIDHDVDLKTMLRRIDNYTLESTLLGALAFSAFVTILVESQTPIGDLSWVLGYIVEQQHINLFGYSMNIPMATNFAELTKQHVSSAVGAFLLSGAVSFLAVLVARIQFTDAYRHAEKLHSKAAKLNEIEHTLREKSSDRAEHYTRQVGVVLTELAEACKRISPIIRFMRGFRTLGLWLFLFATAICGLYYSFAFMVVIFVLFVASFVYFVFYENFTIGTIVRRVKVLNWVLPRGSEHERERMPSTA